MAREDVRDTAFAVTLAVITGYVDAIGFTRLFGVFPANQSGNVVLFGIAVGDARLVDWWRPALAMGAFALGVALAYRPGRRLPDRHRRAVLLLCEAMLLVAVAALAGDVEGVRPPMGGGKEVLVLALAALAMGLQTDILGRAWGVSLSTTFETGAIVRISETVTDAVPGAEGGAGTRAGRRVVVVLSVIVACYAGGAALGSLVARYWGGALWVPAALAVALAAGSYVGVSRPADPGRP